MEPKRCVRRSSGRDSLQVDTCCHGEQEPSSRPSERLDLTDLMEEQWALSPPDSFLGRIGADVFRRRKLPLPPTVMTTISTHMRLSLLASGHFLTLLPTTLLRHKSNSAWLRALNVDLRDSTGPVASITVRERRCGGA